MSNYFAAQLATESEWIVLSLVGVVAAMLGLLAYIGLQKAYSSSRAIRERLDSGAKTDAKQDRTSKRLRLYFEKAQDNRSDALTQRLHQAGFYGRRAAGIYYAVKYTMVLSTSLCGFILARTLLDLPLHLAFAAGVIPGALFFILAGTYLNNRAKKNLRAYRRAFPDFMDMMIVCADAGLSLDASIARVSEELAENAPELGLHLQVMKLEMRAGRTMREALHGLARRTGLSEARNLAVLFQQSEELGTSLINALRIYSEEMRQQRVTAAEERANALPIKMLLPLGGCVFPVILIVVLLPVIARLSKVM